MKKKPLASVSERGSLSESQWRTKKEEKKGAEVRPRARRGGKYVPEHWGRGCVPKCGAKGRGRRRGDGEARENNLESFVASLTVRAWEPSVCGNFTKSAMSVPRHLLVTLPGLVCHFSDSSPPTQQQLFQSNTHQMVSFSFFLSFPLTVPLFSQVHRVPLSREGVPFFLESARAAPLPPGSCFFLFSFPR